MNCEELLDFGLFVDAPTSRHHFIAWFTPSPSRPTSSVPRIVRPVPVTATLRSNSRYLAKIFIQTVWYIHVR
jgi:hypothetical protein